MGIPRTVTTWLVQRWPLAGAMAAALVVLLSCEAPAVAPTPVPPVVTPPPPPAAPDNPHRYGRKVLSGPFYATDARYGFYDTPGNIEVILAGTDPVRQIGSRLIVADAEDPLNTGIRSAERVPCAALAAVYLNVSAGGIGGGGGDGDLELPRARAIADACGKPVLVYYDRPNTLDPWVRALLRPGDILGVNAYPDVVPAPPDLARDLADFDAALALARSWGHPVAVIRPFYTRTGQWPLDYILSFQVPITDRIRAAPEVVMDLWFSWSRPDVPRTEGALDYPELQQHARWLDEAARTGR